MKNNFKLILVFTLGLMITNTSCSKNEVEQLTHNADFVQTPLSDKQNNQLKLAPEIRITAGLWDGDMDSPGINCSDQSNLCFIIFIDDKGAYNKGVYVNDYTVDEAIYIENSEITAFNEGEGFSYYELSIPISEGVIHDVSFSTILSDLEDL